jgi:hypothetical protein
MKPLYFQLAVKISIGTSFPLAAMFLVQFYTQLDLLHTDEMAGESCHTVATVFNSSVLQAFLWEHAKGYSTDGRKPLSHGRNWQKCRRPLLLVLIS